ncbi:hypothetical protein M3223_05885 [Paenibacillus pasadenensis]|uniref:hypothetical protein n=1 Tax=Paenibacillus pasadenensis TaxID=217090 RepID=UPI00203C4A8E|nr:hypothetical protein [Paenibacillus pasadenensis]MCM3746882.1 hypothetical protein [Paenibacillus pasadenensis]
MPAKPAGSSKGQTAGPASERSPSSLPESAQKPAARSRQADAKAPRINPTKRKQERMNKQQAKPARSIGKKDRQSFKGQKAENRRMPQTVPVHSPPSQPFPEQCAAVLTGSSKEVLEQRAAAFAALGCRRLVLVLYGDPLNGMEELDGWLTVESAEVERNEQPFWLAEVGDITEQPVFRIKLSGGGAAAARAAGAAAAAGMNPAALLVADADAAQEPEGIAMLHTALRAAGPGFPAAALPDDRACQMPFARWSASTRLNAFLHWSLGGEKRLSVSFERAPFALNGAALRLLAGQKLASPPHALAAFLTSGGIAIPVQTRTPSIAENSPQLCYLQAIYSSARTPRQSYPDQSRNRLAAATMQ